MSIIVRILITLGFFFFIDLYAYQAVKQLAREQWVWKALWWGSTALVLVAFVWMMIAMNNHGRLKANATLMWALALMLLVYIPKMVTAIPLLIEDFLRIIGWIFSFFVSSDEGSSFPARRRFVSMLALGLAALPFVGILYGVWKGRYRFRVIDLEMAFDNLPEAFDGFSIVQISDFHVGSFDNAEKLKYGIDLVSAQNGDCLLFTGDMVNNSADELDAWQDLVGSLQANGPKLAVLGNHDYGDYMTWPSAEAKIQNLESLKQREKQMGFQMLNNDHIEIQRNGQKIYIAGVENWGKPPFPQHGDLKKALKGIPEDGFTVLMSHDPSHFDLEVKQHSKKVHLTLSGHTHGMQFGIEIPGWIKWSPVKWRYAKWAGLYEELGRYLYVNRGFGYLAFPGRVGIWPEVTKIVLRKK